MNGKNYDFKKFEFGPYANIIAAVVESLKAESYLELGVHQMGTFKLIQPLVPYAVAVDIDETYASGYQNFYKSTTDEWFAQNKQTFDVIFIDACHDIDFVKRDFANSLKILNKRGVIFLHDTDPAEPIFASINYCHNSYLMNAHLKSNYPHLNFVTLPTANSGITIVNNLEDARYKEFAELKFKL
jgi:predicted O-methyltransferase YrrM